MSPIGGVGINLAVQHAIAAANRLAAPLAAGQPLTDADLDAVRRRRRLATRIIQGFQGLAQDRLFKPGLADGHAKIDPTPLKLLAGTPFLGRMIGLGIRLERVKSPGLKTPGKDQAGPIPAPPSDQVPQALTDTARLARTRSGHPRKRRR